MRSGYVRSLQGCEQLVHAAVIANDAVLLDTLVREYAAAFTQDKLNLAAKCGRLAVLKWAYERRVAQRLITAHLPTLAAEGQQLATFRWLCHQKTPYNWATTLGVSVAGSGSVEILQYIVAKDCPIVWPVVCQAMAAGALRCTAAPE
ncbi:hypothetical protein JKP88DRAFT_288763 [Tribonema minus]|uniref:Uncharacterized protein n=1 Tax=Tribonema minus TaxID=303371 RepID=A0A836CIA3_9STRA|nr:hypothetical protein JKP88DRAFT_288763 [Tribonema minus]